MELLTEYADAVVTENSSSIATDNINLLVVNISDKGDRDFTYKPILYNNETEEVRVYLHTSHSSIWIKVSNDKNVRGAHSIEATYMYTVYHYVDPAIS